MIEQILIQVLIMMAYEANESKEKISMLTYLVPPKRYKRLSMTRQTCRRRGFGTIPLLSTELH